jgi:lactoylglutathione lyase
VIAVDDAAAVCERARAQGLRVKREPSPSRAGTGATIAVIEDPDGNPIEIVQLHDA